MQHQISLGRPLGPVNRGRHPLLCFLAREKLLRDISRVSAVSSSEATSQPASQTSIYGPSNSRTASNTAIGAGSSFLLLQEPHELALDIANRGAQRRQQIGLAKDDVAQRLAVDQAVRTDYGVAELSHDPVKRRFARLIHGVNMSVGVNVTGGVSLGKVLAQQTTCHMRWIR